MNRTTSTTTILINTQKLLNKTQKITTSTDNVSNVDSSRLKAYQSGLF